MIDLTLQQALDLINELLISVFSTKTRQFL